MIHKSHKGRSVDMEALRRQHEQTVAAGNMGVNAKGDKLGPGGQVVETTQKRARKHYNATTTSKSNMSVKGDQSAEEIFEEEKTKGQGQELANDDRQQSKGKSKKRKVERETESGDIVLEEAPDVREGDE